MEMVCRNVEFSDANTCSSSLSEDLLLATMCMIGLPVEVHVKDGSVYAGIFHTACVEDDYGVVLKKARMIKKGSGDANVGNGGVIDTLVILSGDFVQVVAKGILLPSCVLAGDVTGDDTEAVGSVPTSGLQGVESKGMALEETQINQTRNLSACENGLAHDCTVGKDDHRAFLANNVENYPDDAHEREERQNPGEFEEASDMFACRRQFGDDQLRREQDHHGHEESADNVQESCFRSDNISRANPDEGRETKKLCKQLEPPTLVKLENQSCERPTSANSSMDDASVSSSTSPMPAVNVALQSRHSHVATAIESIPPRGSEPNKSAKEFKLNPGAKVFSPSFANPMPMTPAVPTVAGMGYIANTSPVVAVSQPEVGFNHHPSMPAKFVPYPSLTAGTGGNGPQFSQAIAGHVGARAQPLRYGSQYPVQVGTAYVPPSSQSVMVGRLGQLVYLHPVSHDLVQGATVISPVSARPLLASQQSPFPKHQGTAANQALQLCMPPPFMASGHQPLAVPSHVPLLQPPFPANCPIQVPGPNGLHSTKFS